jgi:hypothetical protein
MNDLTKELVRQCWNQRLDGPDFNLELYTKLVVLQCCEVAHCNFHVDGLTLGTLLKEHFGITDE